MLEAGLYYIPMLISMLIILVVSCFWLGLYVVKRDTIKRKTKISGFFPKLSVLIPAYNEEGNIGNILKSVLKSNYPKKNMEVLVIDDGSDDNTASIVRKYPVKLISYNKNKGKIYALNKGIKEAKGDIIVTTDADTKLGINTISYLAQHFKNPKVGAVSGVYKAVHRYSFKGNFFKTLLEKFQYLEYLGFALTRKKQEVINSVLVVPGAVGAYRKTALLDVGGFDNDTIIEDYDMTIKMHKAGYKIECDKDALAWIIAPQSMDALKRERIRWFRGGFQVMFRKHPDVFRGKLGAVSFIWMLEGSGILLQFLVFGMAWYEMAARFSDILAAGIWNSILLFLTNLVTLNITILNGIFLTGMAIFVIGAINTAISIRLSKEPMKKILLYPLMMVYTSFLFFIYIWSIILEVRGKESVWVKAEA